MTFFRCTHPDISLLLIPHYIPVDQSRLDIGWELHERLRTSPDETLVLVAEQDNSICAMVIAYTRESDVFIWQARAMPKFTKSREMFNLVVNWSKSKNRNRIVAKSPRAKALARKWHFAANGDEVIKEI